MNEATRLPDVTKFVQAVDDFSVYAGRLVFQPPFWMIYPTKDWKHFESAGVFIYRTCRKYIDEAHKDLLSSGAYKQTILGQYLERKDLFNLSMSDVVSVMSEFLIGGVDTVQTPTHSFKSHFLLYPIIFMIYKNRRPFLYTICCMSLAPKRIYNRICTMRSVQSWSQVSQ